MHAVPISLHPEVEVKVTINVARNADEAQRQARGENVTVVREQTDEEEAAQTAETFFEKPKADEDVEDSDQGKGDEKTG
jgi:large subunit ribosomal protein L9